MHDIEDTVDRVSRALGPDSDPARVEAIASSLLEGNNPASIFTGGRLHIALHDCSSLLTKTVRARGYDKIRRVACHLASSVGEAGLSGALHLATTPLTRIAGAATASDIIILAGMLDDVARDCSASEITGLTACAERGTAAADAALLSAIPEALHATSRVVVDVRAASPETGVNVDAVMKVIAALRRFNGTSEDLLRLRLRNAHPAMPYAADAVFYLTADATTLIDGALEAAPDAPVNEVADLLSATAVGLGRAAAQKGDAAAAILRSRSGQNVRFGGIEVAPGAESPPGSILRRAFAAAIAAGFRAATPGAEVLPLRTAAAFSAATTDGGAGAWLVERLAQSGPTDLAVHAFFSTRNVDDRVSLGPFNQLLVREPVEPDWVRRGGRIPPVWGIRP